MKLNVLAVLAILCLSIGSALPAQEAPHSDISPQGFSGILNIPTGYVQQNGTFDALYSNQKDNLRAVGVPKWQDNYIFSVGLFSFAEIGARLTNTVSGDMYVNTGGVRDLSANVKFTTAPLTARFRFSPALAVGVQDAEGGASFLRTTYVAASADPLGWLRLSTGYGHGPDRMKGAFGGLELRAHDWVTLLGEYDASKTNVGARLTTPALPYIRARLTATVSTPPQHSQDIAFSFGLIVPFDTSKAKHDNAAQKTLWGALTAKKVQPSTLPALEPVPLPQVAQAHPAASPEPVLVAQSQSAPSPKPAPAAVVPTQEPCCQNSVVDLASLGVLQDRLVKAGFVNVRVGTQGKTLVVEYENIRYNHNELDAIGVVAGIVGQAAGPSAEQLRLVIRRKGLALLQIEAPLLPLRDWLEGDDPARAPTLTVSQELADTKGVNFVGGNANPGRLKPSVMVYPSLTTLVGTEYGVFDYQLSIKPELQVPFWRGATGVTRLDIPVAWSHNLDNGQVYSSYRTSKQIDRLMFFQAVPLAPGLVANLGGGKVLSKTYGTLNELNWTPGGGMHRFQAIQSWGEDNTLSSNHRNVMLASYRLFLARRNLALEATGGRFWAQDKGVTVDLKRNFRDVIVSLYYSDSKTPNDSKRWQQGGIRFELPLTPRRDMAARPVQIRGSEAWTYDQETVISSSDTKVNYINASLAVVPQPTQSLALYYYDRERLNEDYILSHTERIREAWRHFRNGL